MSQVNVRDKVAGFIVQLASLSDRWDRDASPALIRCRNGLGRSSDPKVVAMRQAVPGEVHGLQGPLPHPGSAAPPTPSAHAPVSHTHLTTAAAKAAAALWFPRLPLCAGKPWRTACPTRGLPT